MGESINSIVDNFSKNQLIGYFLILWAATFLFSAISGIMWLAEGHGSAIDTVVDGLWNLSELGCAVILAMLGLKILNNQ